MHRAIAITTSNERSDTMYSNCTTRETNFLRFRLGQHSEWVPSDWFVFLVKLILSTTAEHNIRSLIPYHMNKQK